MSDEVTRIVLSNWEAMIVGLLILSGFIEFLRGWFRIMTKLIKLTNKLLARLRIKLIFLLIGNRSIITNCTFLSGHVVPKHRVGLFYKCNYNDGVLVSGINICEYVNNKQDDKDD